MSHAFDSSWLNAGGKGTRVLVLDSGVEASHPAFEGRAIVCRRIERVSDGPEPNFNIETEDPIDSLGHGTAVMGILHRRLPEADLESLRVLGSDLRGSARLVLAGLMWGIERGYDVINCSFCTTNEIHLPAYKKAVDWAFCKKVILVSASHNGDYRRESYPAFFPTVLSTAAGELQDLSLKRLPGQLVEFRARGENIRVAWKQHSYRKVTGSSFAAPHLTALAAKIRAHRPEWNAIQVKNALYDYCESSSG